MCSSYHVLSFLVSRWVVLIDDGMLACETVERGVQGRQTKGNRKGGNNMKQPSI